MCAVYVCAAAALALEGFAIEWIIGPWSFRRGGPGAEAKAYTRSDFSST